MGDKSARPLSWTIAGIARGKHANERERVAASMAANRTQQKAVRRRMAKASRRQNRQ